MANRQDTTGAIGAIIERAAQAVTGRQPYHLEVIGPAHGVALSVVSFEAVERLGEPFRITIELTHPQDLVRADYLGRDATFTIDPADGTAPRKFAGCITGFSKLGTTPDFSSYRLVVEAHVARLRITRTSRIYQHQSAPQIIEAILRRHGLKGHQFRFKLRRDYPQHAFRFQYQCSDWDYIQILMQQSGMYSYHVQGKFGDELIFGDDIDHYLYTPQRTVPYRETAGLESGQEAVFALQTHASVVAQSILVADYNPDAAWEPIQAEANVAPKDTTTYGQPYIFGTHHLDQAGAKWEARLRHEAEMAWQLVYEGQSNVRELCPAQILRTDRPEPDAPDGMAVIEVIHRGARDAAYRNSFKAIPSDRRFRLKIEDHRWPKITGPLTARVTSPNDYPYAYLDRNGRYTVRFELDFDKWNPGGESVPLRMAKPLAGKHQTGLHLPAITGDEALVMFDGGDPNKPYIAGFRHNSIHRDLITCEDRWLSRNRLYTQSGNLMELDDWKGEEYARFSTEHSGKSQLTLGYINDGRWEKRGEGFELRTSGWGAIRSGRGLLVSTDDRPNAKGKQLDMQEAMARLGAAQTMMEQLATTANAAKAEAADAKAMNDVLQGQIKDLRQAVMVLSANASIALSTPESIQHSAGRTLTLTAGDNADVGALRKFTVAAGEAISLFAQRMGVKVFANQGKVDIQAQGDAMALAALKDINITSTNGKLILSAKDEVWIGAGGSYIKINGNRIENGTSGDILEKCASWDKVSAGSQRVSASLASPAKGCTVRGEQANEANAALMGAGV